MSLPAPFCPFLCPDRLCGIKEPQRTPDAPGQIGPLVTRRQYPYAFPHRGPPPQHPRPRDHRRARAWRQRRARCYLVTSYADTSTGYSRGCAATYNYSEFTGAHFVSDAGNFAPCPPSPYVADGTSTVTYSGSTKAAGKLRSSVDRSSASRPNAIASAYAATDLAKGQVHLSALSSGAGLPRAAASAELQDTLHFTITGAKASTVTLVSVRFTFDGVFSGHADNNYAGTFLTYHFDFGNAVIVTNDHNAAAFGYKNFGVLKLN